MANDPTRRTRTARLHAEPPLLPLLFELAQALHEETNNEVALREILAVIHDHSGILRGALLLEPYGEMPATIDAGNDDNPRAAAIASQAIADTLNQVFQNGTPVIIPEYNAGGLAKRGRETTIVALPIRNAGRTIGAIAAEWPTFSTKKDDPTPLQTLQAVAALITRTLTIREESFQERDRMILTVDGLLAQVERKYHPSNIVGNSRQMRTIFDELSRYARTNAPVLIRGMSGTGKELVAHAIHYNSARASKPFVKVHCGSTNQDRLTRELFGYDGPGDLTTPRRGKIELAQGGTLLLDRVSLLSPDLQQRVLRLLQSGEIVRDQGTITRRVDLRILFTDEANLEALQQQGGFDEKLLALLAPQTLTLPTLRERASDITQLVDFFIARYNELHDKHVRRVSTPAIDMLMAYHWPGNVRELENCIEHAVLASDDGVIHGHQLPPSLQSAEASDTEFTGGLQASLDNLERELIIDALKSTGGNMARAARQLAISERIMGLRIKRFQIDPKRYKS